MRFATHIAAVLLGLAFGVAWHPLPAADRVQLPDLHHVICLDGSQQLKIANLKGVCPL